LYPLDVDNYQGGRTERVGVLNTAGAVLDSRSVAQFQGGQYLVWILSGHVILRLTNTNGPANAVMSALLFGGGAATAPSGGTAAFVKTDTATQRSWKSAYGSDGGNGSGDSPAYPSYRG